MYSLQSSHLEVLSGKFTGHFKKQHFYRFCVFFVNFNFVACATTQQQWRLIADFWRNLLFDPFGDKNIESKIKLETISYSPCLQFRCTSAAKSKSTSVFISTTTTNYLRNFFSDFSSQPLRFQKGGDVLLKKMRFRFKYPANGYLNKKNRLSKHSKGLNSKRPIQ